MRRIFLALAVCSLFTFQLWSQGQPAAPAIEVTKITDNVYTFRNQNSLSMFIVTPEGVIVTDPVGYGRPQGGAQYLAEIRKITQAPIRYVIYSHHHYDHIAGGQVFKEAGARFVAHRNALERLRALNEPHTVLPDETFDTNRTIRLGGVAIELSHVGRNHSDSTIVMRLPQERIIFLVDLVPVGQIPGRGMIDFYPMEAEQSLRRIAAMDWDRLIPGHPGVNNRLGTKQDVQDQLTFLQEASAAVRAEAREGRCWEPVESTLKLPKYASWGGYEANLPFVLRRYCALWGRGF
jgi:glyoxylase-like metal-dependent hydrolase (beta-lactamase superfamily II)